MEAKYYECHITLESVLDPLRLELLKNVCGEFDFRVADLLLQRRSDDTPERSSRDSFCTARAKNYETLVSMMDHCVLKLRDEGFTVWRKKIEAVVLDERLVPKKTS